MALKRKALSPLIATVLLIAFAVALGAVVMNWAKPTGPGGGGPPTTLVKGANCSQVTFVVEKIGNNPQVCLSRTAANTLSFIVDNQGGIKIARIKVTVIGASGEPLNQDVPNSAIGEAEVKKISVSYPPELGSIAKVKITPVLADYANDKDLYCTDKTVETDDVRQC
jgi:flagellin-like protein